MRYSNKMKSSFPVLADKKRCTGCMACVDACSVHAIKKCLDLDGHYYVDIYKDKCIGCKRCERICGAIQEGNGNSDFHESQVFAGWADNMLVAEEGALTLKT